jgi:hypothetical protein
MRFTPSILAKLLEPIKRRQFDRLVERHAGTIDKPPPVNPSRPQCQNSQNQLSLSYAMPDSPQTALRTAGGGGVRPKGWEDEIRISRRTLPRHPPDWDPGVGTLSRVQERGFPLLLVGVSA